ncbi:hypothetical protein CS022_21495 [Veronia nyctiphanis]|uniref:Uncharacterized protein n=1 Tax=Veronia nyctiphanis TaxID=1278244 RepID=A0A4Q0YPY6_9GAMM|nr:hypothetical protein [Veronia nyctiphanis]RXJ71239.1 hypothetical protein CS022_21495 [Veronia nyctiphanis]
MKDDKDAIKEAKRMSSSLLVQNVVDHLRDTALQSTAVAGKAFQKWLTQPVNLFFLLIIIVALLQLVFAIIQGLLMVLLSKLMR